MASLDPPLPPADQPPTKRRKCGNCSEFGHNRRTCPAAPVELLDSLEKRYLAMFIPGQELSLDETLVRAYGRIKFKVRIITKSARYGIKLYVITDAATSSYILRVIVYTGKSTYTPGIQGEVMEEKKTVQIVTRLVEPFVGTHRTIYVDRFYTSIDLLKALRDRDLYVTGTVMAN